MRVIGIDPGARRVGVAIGHTATGVATPYEVWPRREGKSLADRLRDCVAEWDAERVVMGLPRSLDGTEGPAARAARELAAELSRAVGVPVELHDERFSTVTAQASLHQGGLDTRRSRKIVDAVAASVILQSWLDAQREEDA
ncbi:MAG TPA: Holliday junction resolvase RuvX [Acidimicrobiales bacterium]|nr:Holliday junction resolvase RuvX [Acidimicrobiales bacterium]